MKLLLLSLLFFFCYLPCGLTLSDSEFILSKDGTEINIDSSYNIISTYNMKDQYLSIKFYLKDFSAVGLELYDQSGHLVKLWTPHLENAGEYISQLSMADLPDGTYLLQVFINDDYFQQAVFKY